MKFESSEFGNSSSNDTIFDKAEKLQSDGSTSDVYKVQLHGKWHFLKRPKKEFSKNPLYIHAFEKEFELGFLLDHPNIVRYINKDSDADGVYLITEYVDGLSLNKFLDSNNSYRSDAELIKKLFLQIISALEYLHNKQIFHLDLKPQNILITAKGHNVKIIDLGFSTSDTYSNIACGTPNFSSPEQFTTPNLVDSRSDIYALGNLLFYMFTGSIDHAKSTLLPRPFNRIANGCVNIEQNLRYSSVSQIRKALEQDEKRYNILKMSVAGTFVLVVALVVFYNLFNNINSSIKSEVHSALNVNEENRKTEVKEVKEVREDIKALKTDVAVVKSDMVRTTAKATAQDSIRAKIRIRLKKIYAPLYTFSSMTDENHEEMKLLFQKLYYKAMDYRSEIVNSAASTSELNGNIVPIFKQELDGVTSKYLSMAAAYSQSWSGLSKDSLNARLKRCDEIEKRRASK